MSPTLVIRPFQTPARGVAQVPGSKSITNRALILAALADGVTLFTGALFSRDTRIMVAALRAHPDCALMLGDPGAKGDPLTHPRLMLRARARFVAADDPGRAALRAHWLKGHPKAALYVDFADFAFVHLQPLSALLNAGFAKAYRLTPDDLCAAPL